MRIGIFADTHDHLDHIRRAVEQFNQRDCELVIFGGDLVSTFAIPPLRKLHCPMVACFGDNEGNRRGILAGMSIVGPIADPPFGFRAPDGTRFLVTHQRELLRRYLPEARMIQDADVVVYAHSHRPSIERDREGRWWINPGETSGWTYHEPTIVLFETNPAAAELIRL